MALKIRGITVDPGKHFVRINGQQVKTLRRNGVDIVWTRIDAPIITRQPVNSPNVIENQSYTFSLEASSGDGTNHYQWYNSATVGDESNPVGTDSPSFTNNTPNVGTHYYWCKVWNERGSVNSRLVSVYVDWDVHAPVFTSQPSDVHFDTGGTASFSVAVDWNKNVGTLQWYKNGVKVGGNSTSYSFAAGVGDHGSQVKCVATNSKGSVTSNIAHVYIKNLGRHEFYSNDSLNLSPACKRVVIHGFGPGGGGGGAGSWHYDNGWKRKGGAGGGGGAGEYIRLEMAVGGGELVKVSCYPGGAGGVGGVANGSTGANGKDGQDTTVEIGGSIKYRARGGKGGRTGNNGNFTGGDGGASGAGTAGGKGGPLAWVDNGVNSHGFDGSNGSGGGGSGDTDRRDSPIQTNYTGGNGGSGAQAGGLGATYGGSHAWHGHAGGGGGGSVSNDYGKGYRGGNGAMRGMNKDDPWKKVATQGGRGCGGGGGGTAYNEASITKGANGGGGYVVIEEYSS